MNQNLKSRVAGLWRSAGCPTLLCLVCGIKTYGCSLSSNPLQLSLRFCGCPTLRGLCEGWDAFDCCAAFI